MTTFGRVVLASGFAWATFGLAQTLPPAAEVATVEGLVTNIADGRPVGGATVTLESETRDRNPRPVTTDSTGRYQFVDILPDQYHIRVEASGFLTYQSRRDPNRLPIQARPGGVVRSDHPMSRGARIVGRVADASGNPIVGADLVVERHAYTFGRRYRERLHPGLGALTLPGIRSTDDEGRFRVERLPEGDYYISVGVTPMSRIYYPSTSDPEGAVAIRVTRDAEIGGRELAGINIRWHAVPTVAVRGWVEGIEESERASVALFGPGGRPAPHFGFALVGADGRFEVNAPPRAEYELHTAQFSGSLAPPSNAAITSLYVGDEDVNDVAVSLRPATDLDVEFVWESTPPSDFPWDQLRVVLIRPFVGTVQNSGTPSNGQVTLRNAAPIPLHLQVRELPQGVYVESATHGAIDALAGEFNPADNLQAALRIRLGNQPGLIQGTVVKPNGDPVMGAVVTLVPEADRRQRLDLFETLTSGRDGRFAFESAAPGTYLIMAWDSIPPGAIQNEQFRLPYESRGTRVHVDRLGAADVEVGLIERLTP